MDTGVNSNHEDLENLIYENPGETRNRIDDDGNGFIDDTAGYDFVRMDSDPADEDGHGTALAGAIGAIQGNGRGIDGIANGVKILNIRILDGEGDGFVSDAIRGIRYASSFDIDLMNCSWGTMTFSEELFLAFQELTDNDILVVTAAGNSANDITTRSYAEYPACFDLENLLCIGSYGRGGEISQFSNHSSHKVDWLLPGEDLYLPGLQNESYSLVSGTSVSAAIMSGIMALARNRFPENSWAEIIDRAKRSTPPHEPFYVNFYEYSHFAQYYGMLDLLRLLEENYLSIPEISVSISPDSYLFGDTVTISAEGINGMMGHRTWYVGVADGVIGEHTDTISLKTDYSNRDWDIYFRFGTYYGETIIGPVRLRPDELGLRLTSGFQYTYHLNGEGLEVNAPLEGSDPISVTWYSANTAYEVARGPSLDLRSDYLGLDENYYFIAENPVNLIQSPVFQVVDRNGLDMRAIPFMGKLSNVNSISNWDSTPLEDVVYGNGRYLGVNRINWYDENYISFDGINWHILNNFIEIELSQLDFFKNQFVGLAYNRLYQSPDGFTWSPITEFPVEGFRVANQYLVVWDISGQHWRSSDGVNWTESDPFWYGGGYYYRTHALVPVQYSTDLINWQDIQAEGDTFTGERVDDLQYAEDLWLMGLGDWCIASRDGINWTGIFDLGNIQNLVYEGGAYYCGRPSQLTSISPDLEITRRYGPYVDGFLKRLSNGQLFGSISRNGEAVILVKDSYKLMDSPFLEWEATVNQELVLGDPLTVYFDYPEVEIDCLELYVGNVLQERRETAPYYGDYYPSLIGSYEVLAVLKLSDGSTRFSDSLPVSIQMPLTKYEIQENRLYWEPAILGNGDNLGIVYQAGTLFSRQLVLVPDINDMGSKILIGDSLKPAQGSNRSHYAFRSPDGDRVSVLTIEPEGVRRYYEVHPDGTHQELTTFSDVPADLEVFFQDPDFILYDFDSAEGSWAHAFHPDGSQTPLWMVPPFHVVWGDQAGESHFSNSLYGVRRFGSNLIYPDPSSVWNPVANQRWQLPYKSEIPDQEYRVGGYFGDWISLTMEWGSVRERRSDTRYLVHTDGRVHPYDFGEDFFYMLDFVDSQGYYFAYMEGGDERLVLAPRNEIVLRADHHNPEPRAKSSEEGLMLEIPISVEQLSVGPGREMALSMDVYLSRDPEPDIDTADYLGREVLLSPLERGGQIYASVRVPITTQLAPGSYSVGVVANPGETDFPDRSHNNTVWFQWTVESDPITTITQNPDIGVITLDISGEVLSFGEEVSIHFEPRPGFKFSGWGGDLDGIENPTVRFMPNKLSVQAGALPDALADLFPDARYSGINLWHASETFGWFESEFHPWVYHLDHGWIYMQIDSSAKSLHYFDSELGWIYTNPNAYPYLYLYTTGRWIYFLKNSGSPRWFYDLESNSWFSLGD